MLAHFDIRPVDAELDGRVTARIDRKTKPPGSLGRIETLARELALAQRTDDPVADPAELLIFAGDHGIVAEGVSAWPSEVTGQMVRNFLAGGAAANVFARAGGCMVKVVDAGVASALPDHLDLLRAGIRAGTRNAVIEDALTPEEVEAALAFGADLARRAVARGVRVIALGEMGIGNTSAATLLAHAVAELPLEGLLGRGAGLDDVGLERKLAVLTRAAERRPGRLEPLEALAAFGGLEIAAMAGALIGGASARAAVLVDGFVATSAALVALAARPEARASCIFAHESHEAGHHLMLTHVHAEPLLRLDMRLGEGTGALLALPLLRAAARMLAEMATFESAGVSDRTG